MYNIGIIGYGKMGQIRHRELNSIPKARVVAIYDVNNENANNLFVDNEDIIINDSSVDVIFVCTPNYLNKDLTIRGLNSGKHVFCEKPPAFNANEVEEIRTVEKMSGKVLAYGFNHRHHLSIKKIKSLVDSQKYGRVLWMRGRYGKSVDQSFFKNWRARKKYAGGGILIDQGIHMLDLMLHLAHDFDEIQAMVSNLYWNLNVEDNVFVNLRNTKNGIVASLHSTMTQWRHLFSLEIFLENGYMALNGLKTSSNSYGEEILSVANNRSTAPAATWEDEEHFTYRDDRSWASEINEFFNAIEEGRFVKNGNSSDALKLMIIIDKIYSNK